MSWRRLLGAGCAAAALVGLAGGVLDFWRFGANDAATAARVEAGVKRRFDEMTAALSGVADRLSSNPATARALAADAEGDRTLFDLVAAARPADTKGDEIAITLYDKEGNARAWLGRPSDTFQRDRTTGPAAFFVSPSPLGLRLVHIRPIVAADGRRVGAVAAEHDLSPAAMPTTMMSENFTLATPIAPVSLRMRWAGAGENPAPGAFVLRDPSGEPLAEATVNTADLRLARAAWRHRIAGVVLAVGGTVLLLLIGPLLDRRLPLAASASVVRVSLAASVLLLAGMGVIWTALRLASGAWPSTSITLILAGICASALAALWASPAVRLRVALRTRRRVPPAAPGRFVVMQLIAGASVGVLLGAYQALLNTVVDPNAVDLRHFSLYPWNPDRTGLLAGILGLHVAVLWAASLILVAAAAAWRLRRSPRNAALLLSLWAIPIIVVAGLAASRGWPLPAGAVMTATFACSLAALYGQRLATWYRHTTVASRILALFLAFLFPALLLYPSVNYFSERATRSLVATRYAVEVQKHDQRLRDAMSQAMTEINALTELPDLVAGAPDVLLASPRTESAFLVWSQTTLARERLTSAVELYDRKGELVSRFALNFPEYTGTAQKPQPSLSCNWDLFGESQPFGSEERNMLHAERRICDDGPNGGPPVVVGTIVVHVLLRDYRTLPFITSESPYFELFRATDGATSTEPPAGGDVTVAIYGWGLQTLYASERTAWPITDALFRRIYDPNRAPFWVQIPLGDRLFNVYFSNDRAAIYALGYPSLTLFDRLVHVAELTTLAGIAFVVVLLGTAVFTRIGRERPRVGRALLREIRASFYRKLFLAFVLAAVIPVLTLALVIRAYFADLLRNDVQAEAARTAAVAQRVIEESDALQRRSANRLAPVSDDVMVWISQVIDQDVNIFNGARLVATSERDLFSSGLLPTRTPDDVYRAITLQRLPSFVGEDEIGSFPYMIAAAPVHAGEKDMILTVPLANRQREIERQIADLDRGVHLAALCFILLGAAIGLSLAERIADPVRRLTRATRRIARGDFDARIAVRSADELKRLVDAFNAMAAELAKQRVQLERTHRLEAWAEMARQVAHEIKNPLTPIQLSAEHLQRVHVDRGEPMGPVLDSCVESILGQVRLLRQIAAEFSSFASSPTARLASVDVAPLVAEVVDPYRTGLSGRIEIENRATGPLPRVQVDRTLVARALVNVVENALHAMPDTGRLAIDAAADDGYVTIQVRDTGLGMDEEALERVFEPYFSTKTTGTGLGLPIARRNIELSGGTIEVESEKGVGTVVRIVLPQERRA